VRSAGAAVWGVWGVGGEPEGTEVGVVWGWGGGSGVGVGKGKGMG